MDFLAEGEGLDILGTHSCPDPRSQENATSESNNTPAAASPFSFFPRGESSVSNSEGEGDSSYHDGNTIEESDCSARSDGCNDKNNINLTTDDGVGKQDVESEKQELVTSTTENVLTKHVTQRIDKRTNFDCFTGNIDAVTGSLIHGTMIYRQDGAVYEGPFIETAAAKNDSTISIRHGMDATCQYSNGMKFVGRFEFDHPKMGTWIGGDGWTYEGSLVTLVEGKEEVNNAQRKKTNSGKRRLSSGSGNVIGIEQALPGSVLFHGNGRFARSDGLVYQGEFARGVAHGVGRETLPNEQGIYYGEFCDGLRHGVGTLVEVHSEGSAEGEESCNCQCASVGGGENEESWASTENCSDNISSADNINNGQTLDHGPDFAAGGSQPTSPPPPSSASASNSTVPHRSPPKSQCKICGQKAKQRYFVGVWCSGHLEVEDCRGTVQPGSHEFLEDAKDANIATVGAAESDGKKSANEVVSLNRTTWDDLDEKWLGLGA